MYYIISNIEVVVYRIDYYDITIESRLFIFQKWLQIYFINMEQHNEMKGTNCKLYDNS